MSSPKRRPAAKARTKPRKPAAAKAAHGTGASATATQLAAAIERGLKSGKPDLLSPVAVQALMAAVCKSYAAHLEQGQDFMPLGQRSGVTPTEIMVTASKLLRAGNLQVFELGMWQSWTGR
ncbi:MAG TPA: hypothetical protein VMH36_01090 [Alphaproteobacteria bacterium]|nr:hypothetical protein [Alphaproteobacteria bacterium]